MATKKFQIVDGPDRMGLMISQFQYWAGVNFTLIHLDEKDSVRMSLFCQITGLARRPRGGEERTIPSDFEIEGFSCGGGQDHTKKPWQPVRALWPSDFKGFYSTKDRKGWLEFANQKE